MESAQARPWDSIATTDQPTEQKSHIPGGIFFVRDGDVWSAAVDGSEQMQITRNTQIEDYFWCPKTKRLIYDHFDSLGAQIRVLDLASGSERTILTRSLSYEDVGGISPEYTFAISASRDGRRVAYGEDFLEGVNG